MLPEDQVFSPLITRMLATRAFPTALEILSFLVLLFLSYASWLIDPLAPSLSSLISSSMVSDMRSCHPVTYSLPRLCLCLSRASEAPPALCLSPRWVPGFLIPVIMFEASLPVFKSLATNTPSLSIVSLSCWPVTGYIFLHLHMCRDFQPVLDFVVFLWRAHRPLSCLWVGLIPVRLVFRLF